MSEETEVVTPDPAAPPIEETPDAPQAEAIPETETLLDSPEGETPAPEVQPEAEQRVPLERLNTEIYKRKAIERQVEELRNQQQQQQVEQQTIQTATTNKPTLESCEYDEAKFAESLMDWKLDARDQVAKNQQAQQAQQKIVGGYKVKQEEYSAKNPAYQQLAWQADQAGIKFSDDVAEGIMTSDVGVKVHHHLLANPQRLEEINSMAPVARMREIFKLEQKFTAKAAPVKKAAAIISTVQGGTSGGGQNMTNEQMGAMDAKSYYEMRMAARKK